MCFFYKRKLLKQQEELNRQIVELKEENRKEKEENQKFLSQMLNLSSNNIINGLSQYNNAILDNVKNIASSTGEKISLMREELSKSLGDIRFNVDKSLREVREDNEKQLGQMRNVVEEKLAKTVDDRITKSFNAINERLDAVNKGLGEVQSLTANVTDLKKVLSNVKTRGIYGETSLESLLENILTQCQYKKQYQLRKNSAERVDFAVVLPGKKEGNEVYLPIDVKFPLEDYQRIVEASELGDNIALQTAQKQLEVTIKTQARSIKEKYILPPYTVDFAIMYLPIEGLYAEVVRNPGLIEELQNKFKIVPAGPTTITALLNSLSIGFRTLAIQKSSREIYDLLSAFRKTFDQYVSHIEKAQKQVQSAECSLEEATKKSNIMLKKLENVDKYKPEEVELLD